MPVERRHAARQGMRWKGQIVDAGGVVVSECVTADISTSGAKLILPQPAVVPDSFVLILAKIGGVRRQCEVTWRDENSIGVQFVYADIR